MKPITVMSRNGKQHYESPTLRVANGNGTALFTLFSLVWRMKLRYFVERKTENSSENTVETLYNETRSFWVHIRYMGKHFRLIVCNCVVS